MAADGTRMAWFQLQLACLLCIIVVASSSSPIPPSYYTTARNTLMNTEETNAIGANTILTSEEKQVDAILLSARNTDLLSTTGGRALPSLNFFNAKEQILAGKLWPLITSMPKGNALHVHSDSMGDIPWVVKNITYEPFLYYCGSTTPGININDRNVSFIFSDKVPPPASCSFSSFGWRLLSKLRDLSNNVTEFDQSLVRSLSFTSTDTGLSLTEIWFEFGKCLSAVHGLVTYDPMHIRYHQRAYETFARDGINYVEQRQVFQQGIGGNVYTLNGTILPWSRLVHNILTASAAAARTTTFKNVLLIACAIRSTPVAAVQIALQEIHILAGEFPNVVGFDLVGQEDPGRTLLEFVPMLLNQNQNQNPHQQLPYFFHAGETDVVGGSADDNLFDAILLNATRIGHGYALRHHPLLRTKVSQRDICVEVCVLSNQMLGLVSDLRNHPLHVFYAEDLPIVLSSDDPGVWGAAAYPASFDYAAAFYSMNQRHAGLAVLKKLSSNSIRYSMLSGGDGDGGGGGGEKAIAMREWEVAWKEWIGKVLLEEEMENGSVV